MSKAGKRLGRGLDSLVSSLRTPAEKPEPELTTRPTGVADDAAHRESQRPGPHRMMDIASISRNPFQPRSAITDDNVKSLSASIQRNGILQPIAVRATDSGYQIIAGERRWLAARRAGLSHVPVLVRSATNEQMLELALIENIQRDDLNAIDRAMAYRRFCDTFGLSIEDVANRTGEDRSTVANYVRLLDLSETIAAMVANGSLSMGHARCLLGVDDLDRRLTLAEACVRNQLSVRALEDIVRREKEKTGHGPDKRTSVRTQSPHLADMQRRFEEAVRTKVVLREGKKKGSGRIVIEYHSLDEFDRLARQLGVELN